MHSCLTPASARSKRRWRARSTGSPRPPAAEREQRFRIPRSERLESVHPRQEGRRDLVERTARVDLQRPFRPRDVRERRSRSLRDPSRTASRRCLSSETTPPGVRERAELSGLASHQIQEIDIAVGASRAARDPILDREEDRGQGEPFREPGRGDPEDARMPVRGCENNRFASSTGSRASAIASLTTCSSNRRLSMLCRSRTEARKRHLSTSSETSISRAAGASPIRPAAFKRGTIWKAMSIDEIRSASRPAESIKALIAGRGRVRMSSRPARTAARFSSWRVMPSAIVPIAVKSRSAYGSWLGRPAASRSFQSPSASLVVTPTAARSRKGYVESPRHGLISAKAGGSSSSGKW